METFFTVTGDGNITLWLNGNTFVIGNTHPKHEEILEALTEERYDELEDLVNVRVQVARELDGVEISESGVVTFQGREINGAIANRIVAFIKQGLPWKPLARFLRRLMANPSRRAVEELYGFLENEGMAITPEGYVIGYKGVSHDFTDRFSGKFDNSVGRTHEMPRNQVDENPNNPCSYGFHIGSHRYATSWAGGGGNVVLVKFDPADAVAVPVDEAEKLRVCKYEVVALSPDQPLEPALVSTNGGEFNDEELDYWDDEEGSWD